MKCPKCGKEIANDSNFCEFCGSPVGKNSEKNKKARITLGVILVSLVGLAFLLIPHYNQTYVVAVEEPADSTVSDSSEYIDLGLPSGTLWKTINENGFYDYPTAVRQFGSQLPTEEQWEELKSDCQWTWYGSGYEVTGPNEESINLPASGDCGDSGISNVGEFGRYWSSTRWDQNDGVPAAMCISFYSEDIYLYNPSCDFHISVRLVR